MRILGLRASVTLTIGGLSSLVVGQQPSALSLKTRIPLPNVNGRMDHFAVDVKGQRLFVSALGNHTAEVLDVQGSRRLRTLTGLDEPQGQFFDAATNRLFVAMGCADARQEAARSRFSTPVASRARKLSWTRIPSRSSWRKMEPAFS